jgi:hypothetical protein
MDHYDITWILISLTFYCPGIRDFKSRFDGYGSQTSTWGNSISIKIKYNSWFLYSVTNF